MAYETLQDFYDVTALIDAGSIHEYETRGAIYEEDIERDSPEAAIDADSSDEAEETRAFYHDKAAGNVEADSLEADYRRLIAAARVVGPIAFEHLAAQADDPEALTTVPMRDVQIVEADPDKIRQEKSIRFIRSLWNSEKHARSARVTADIIKSFQLASPFSKGWTIVNGLYDPTDNNPFTAEIIMLGSDGELTITQGASLEPYGKPEDLEEPNDAEEQVELVEAERVEEDGDIDLPDEEMLKVPRPIEGISYGTYAEWDAITWDGHAVGPLREIGYDLFTNSARAEVALIGASLMEFVVDAGLDEVLAERARSIS